MLQQSVIQVLESHSRKYPALANQSDEIALLYKEK